MSTAAVQEGSLPPQLPVRPDVTSSVNAPLPPPPPGGDPAQAALILLLAGLRLNLPFLLHYKCAVKNTYVYPERDTTMGLKRTKMFKHFLILLISRTRELAVVRPVSEQLVARDRQEVRVRRKCFRHPEVPRANQWPTSNHFTHKVHYKRRSRNCPVFF